MKTKKVTLIWTGDRRYIGGRLVRKGDPFTASRVDARTYKALGIATDAPMQPAPETPEAQPPVRTPTPAAAGTRARAPARRAAVKPEDDDEERATTRRVYRRRDMTADEE